MTESRGRFFGHPVALAYLAFTETWERFSFYGMTSILVLYMSQALFLPDRIAGIGGFTAFRTALESVSGPLSTLALASQVYGLYTGFVYFTPIIGGWLADRFLGRRSAVLLGASMMAMGHLAMAFDRSFLLALLLLVLGCGLLKGNISAQVGRLYGAQEADRRTRGFAIFSMGINVGAITGPLAVGFLADRYGWHLGFALAGCMMLLALVIYSIGYRLLPTDLPRQPGPQDKAALGRDEWRVLFALLLVMALTVFQSIAFYQNSNMALVWTRDHVDLAIHGFSVPVAWFMSIDPAVSILCVPPLFALWKRLEARGRRRDELRLIGEGAWIAMLANGMLALASAFGARASIVFPIAYNVLLGVSFVYYWPTLLALVSRAAPQRINSTMMGAAFLSLFLSYSIIGAIGRLYEHMAPRDFWLLNAGIAATGGVLALLLRRPVLRALGEST